MRSAFQIWNPLTCLALLFIANSVAAITPQTGIYWNPKKSGTAVYVERQNDQIFIALYGYANADGGPEFYVASGGIVASVPADFLPYEGFYPLQGFSEPLYRVPSGSCLACPYTPISPAQRVGVISLIFTTRERLYAKVRFDGGGTFPNPNDEYGDPMQRFNFALGGVAPTDDPDISGLFIDARGEWVFVDQSDPNRAPWRFHFTTREDGANLSDFPLRASVAFRDVGRSAVFYCFSPDYTGLTDAEFQALPRLGCEVRQGGVTLFWTPNEIAIDEFYGTLGATPPRSANIYRGAQRVVGRRITD